METRSQARAKVGRSPGSPDGVLESPVPRPSSETSETDEDLGLTTLLGDGEALVVGRGRAVESATSGPGDAPAVTERVPAREPVIVSAKSQLTGVDSTLTQVATGSTALKGKVTYSIPTLRLSAQIHTRVCPFRRCRATSESNICSVYAFVFLTASGFIHICVAGLCDTLHAAGLV